MKQITPAIAIALFSLIIMYSCGTSKELSSVERDGLSYETAIIAKSIDFEYQWIQQNYPGAQPQSQILTEHKKKPYDIIIIKTTSGEEIKLYFDISKFFGKRY